MPARKPTEKIIQSTMRVPESLWKRLNYICIDKRLSQNQAVVQAIEQYCDREGKKGGR